MFLSIASTAARWGLPPGMALLAALVATPARAIDLADEPLFSTTSSVPGNLILALSVEWPTATTPAYPSTTAYAAASTFLGYFDPGKCYSYIYNSTTPSSSYFTPYGSASSHACSSSASLQLWSGNYLNWASMQTLDAFRWVLTGGYRSTDTATVTILTKTYAERDASVIPQKTLAVGSSDDPIAGATPFKGSVWSSGVTTRVRALGTRMWFTSTNLTGTTATSTTAAIPGTSSSATTGAVAYTSPATWAAAMAATPTPP
jgi:type IV pilus assembly protein PilY1